MCVCVCVCVCEASGKGGGGAKSQWGQGRTNSAAEMLPNTSCSLGGEGGVSVVTSNDGLALCARHDAGTTSRSGEALAGRAVAAPTCGPASAAFLALAADGGRARPSHAESVLAPTFLVSSA